MGTTIAKLRTTDRTANFRIECFFEPEETLREVNEKMEWLSATAKKLKEHVQHDVPRCTVFIRNAPVWHPEGVWTSVNVEAAVPRMTGNGRLDEHVVPKMMKFLHEHGIDVTRYPPSLFGEIPL